MGKRQFILLLFFSIICSGIFAQSAKMRKALRYIEAFKYEKAIELYLDILEKDDLPEAKAQLAAAYRRINDFKNAEFWYSQIVSLPEASPEQKFNYAQMLMHNGKCNLAEYWFKQYLNLRPYDERKEALLNACAHQQELMSKIVGKVEVRTTNFNSEQQDLGPAFFQNGLVYASNREGKTVDMDGEIRYFMDLFYVDAQLHKTPQGLQFSFGESEQFSNRLNSKLHEGIVAFSKDFKEIFYTRSRKSKKNKSNIIRLEIVSAKQLEAGKWSELEPLPFNSDQYSVAHPSLSPDGQRLYFSSDMPGGFGGKDLYMTTLAEGQWTPPVNLGPTINTSGDELFPYLHRDSSLYFASDGHFGLGGQDIYVVRKNEENEWQKVENLGYPINSIYDDFGIILHPDGNYGFFTSNRDGGSGQDDIYSFFKTDTYIELQITDEESGQPLSGVQVQNECRPKTLTSDAKGRIYMQMRLNECCALQTSLASYLPKGIDICTDSLSAGDTLKFSLSLKMEQKLLLRGMVYDQRTNLPLDGAVLKLITNGCSPVRPIVTEKTGKFEFELEEGCCYQLRAEKGNYFAQTVEEEFCTQGDSPKEMEVEIGLQPFLIENGTQIIATTEPRVYKEKATEVKTFEVSHKQEEDGSIPYLLNIYYDFGRTSVQKEGIPELIKLYKLLADNPELVVEISSHTDSRGNNDYNLDLSQRRADAVVRYLIGQGIEEDRLVAKGYGEGKLVNKCGDGQNCTEEQHQLNRRTEFKVLGLKGQK